jgi:hypothetical protein
MQRACSILSLVVFLAVVFIQHYLKDGIILGKKNFEHEM